VVGDCGDLGQIWINRSNQIFQKPSPTQLTGG